MDTMKQAGYQNVYVYNVVLLQTRLKHPDILNINWVAAYTNVLEWENPYYSGEKVGNIPLLNTWKELWARGRCQRCLVLWWFERGMW